MMIKWDYAGCLLQISRYKECAGGYVDLVFLGVFMALWRSNLILPAYFNKTVHLLLGNGIYTIDIYMVQGFRPKSHEID
jgi:hypothetical protein